MKIRKYSIIIYDDPGIGLWLSYRLLKALLVVSEVVQPLSDIIERKFYNVQYSYNSSHIHDKHQRLIFIEFSKSPFFLNEVLS